MNRATIDERIGKKVRFAHGDGVVEGFIRAINRENEKLLVRMENTGQWINVDSKLVTYATDAA